MSANTNPIFELTPRLAQAVISVAVTTRTGAPPGVVPLITGATNGTRVDRITFQATVTTAAGTLRLFINGSLWKEIPTQGATVSGTVAGENHVLSAVGLVLPSGATLSACTNNAETWNVLVEGGDF